MNVMGELASLLGLTAIGSAIIGWCIRSFTAGGTEKKVRQNLARDMDDAIKDAKHLRLSLHNKDNELKDLRSELQRMQRKDSSTDAGNRSQVGEINELKKKLAASKKTLLDNQTEFNSFRTEAQKEESALKAKLANFTNSSSANSDRLHEANETVAALRSAGRENDKVIDSLRARVKEADSTVENLRNQLKSSESGLSKARTVTTEHDKKLEDLTKQVGESRQTIAKQKREYDLMLDNKNSDIKGLHTKLEDLTKHSATIKTREHEFNKRSEIFKEKENNHLDTVSRYQEEVVDLKKVISERDLALSKSRSQINDLNNQVKSVQEQGQQQVRSKIRSKSAEVAALNDMLKDSASKRDSLQKNLDETNKNLNEKDVQIKSLRGELDDVVASRNKVSTQLGELQAQGNIALEKLQQDFNTLAKTRDSYKSRIDSLQTEVSDLKKSKESELKVLSASSQSNENKLKENNRQLVSESKVLQQEIKTLNTKRGEYKSRIDGLQTQVSELTQAKENQLRELRQELSTRSQQNEDKLKETNQQLNNQNQTLQNDLKTLAAKVKDQTHAIELQKTDLTKHTTLNQRLTTQLDEKDKQVSDFRTKLVREEGESQRLNRELSDTEVLRLTLTERDAELRKLQIELQDAKASGGPMQKTVDDLTRKNDSLINAMRERDEEISRMNTMITNNSVRSKQQTSSINLLTQEKESQSELIKSLELQAENSLHLHTKIAEQSTEIEGLRARIFEHDNQTRTTTSAQSAEATRTTATVDKPRVYVRADGDTEALTGATGYQPSVKRPEFTLDGHKVRRPDGSDDLTLLQGVTQTIAGAFSRHGVTDFEQIGLWSDREVAHYAERVGVSVQRAQQYNWPNAARSIIKGSYRKDGQGVARD